MLSISDAAAEAPGRSFVIAEDGSEHSFTALADAARARPRSTAPVIGATTLETIAECLARMERNIPIALVHPRLTEHERARVIEHARTAPAEGPLAILYTSGSSGEPKGVMLSARAFLASAGATIARLGIDREDRWLLALPLAHAGGFSILTRMLTARAGIVLAGDTASFTEAIDRRRVTIASFVPTMLHRLLRRTPRWDPPPHLRAMIIGGAPTPARVLDEARERGWPLLTTYGLTETASQVSLQTPGTPPGASEGSGVPLPSIELRIQDGELEVRGPARMDGYLGVDPRETFREGGWFATGDLGRLDERGRLFVLGRKSEMIISGGENVHPREVEDALEASLLVERACVVGVPDEEWGERVCAAVIPRDASRDRDATAAALEAYARDRLAPHKRPKTIVLTDSFPLGASGKIDKRGVRELFTGHRSSR